MLLVALRLMKKISDFVDKAQEEPIEKKGAPREDKSDKRNLKNEEKKSEEEAKKRLAASILWKKRKIS